MGVIINVIAIVIGTMIGLFLKRGMSEKMSSHIMQGLALITFYHWIKRSFSRSRYDFVNCFYFTWRISWGNDAIRREYSKICRVGSR